MTLSKICSSTLILLAFTIPVSTAMTYIVLGIFLLFWILDNFKNPLKELTVIIKSNPVAMAGCTFFLIHLAGLIYTHADQEKILESTQNGGKFLFIAMAMIYLKEEKNVRAVLISFISAMGLVLILSYLIRMSMVPGFIPVKGTPLNCYVFHDHIKHNTFMAFTVFVTAVLAGSSKTLKAQVLWTGVSFLSLINVLFMVNGRTGHLIVLILLVYYFFSWSSRKSIVVLSIICICMGLLLWIYPSNSLLTRARIAVNEIKAWKYGEPASNISSSGLRLEFYTNSLKLIKKSPFIGTGTGSFKSSYSELIKDTGFNRSDNPHNEFLMAGVQFGLVGILVLLSFFITQWWYAASLQKNKKILLARGFTLTIMAACMVASPLQDSAEGWFFALMSATLFAPQGYTLT
ncbi:O-antigen ligase family protein [Desulfobacter latus]|nr:O-antigen ligase family protein [Desulfobacter latus]